MKEQFCLKVGPEDVINWNARRAREKVTNELTEQGTTVFVRGTCYIPRRGGSLEGLYVTGEAFETVCWMLEEERKKLAEERNKKWWQRRKR